MQRLTGSVRQAELGDVAEFGVVVFEREFVFFAKCQSLLLPLL